ncbi:hypothetical protein ACIF70_18230 [Actinacidiphila glaucinigra]|uniref:helix-turn-helix domain-containing protein n=1 Tax=Actinacidiphila glaucinigra TaxID=235986 RepID=UPI0037C99BFB
MKAARFAWRRLEPLHGMVYFVPEARNRYTELGLQGRAGYFASRGAALGRASAELVIATFYNFCPDVVRGGATGRLGRGHPRADVGRPARRRGRGLAPGQDP